MSFTLARNNGVLRNTKRLQGYKAKTRNTKSNYVRNVTLFHCLLLFYTPRTNCSQGFLCSPTKSWAVPNLRDAGYQCVVLGGVIGEGKAKPGVLLVCPWSSTTRLQLCIDGEVVWNYGGCV